MSITEKIKSGSRRRVTVGVIVLAIAALVLGAGYFFFAMSYESTDDAFIQGHIVAVSPKVDGHVISVYVQDNQEVRKGDLLAEIDPMDFQVRADLAGAAMAAAQAGEEQSRAQAGIASVEAKRTEKDYNRYQQLFDANASVTQQQLDNASAAAMSADAQLAAANKQIAVAQAMTSEAAVAFDQARLNLSYAKIYAPQSGRVANKALEEGQYIRVGQTLLTIVPPEVWVVANFKETQLKYMEPGQPVKIRIDAYPQKVFKGHVDSIQPGTGAIFSLLPPENATGNYVKVVQRVPVKIVFDEDPNVTKMLSPGISVVPKVKVK
ncbi:MAG: HlyD family secretion protein [Sedimentisphaerales bacterium]|jgi:membrane fusion protein (multidrug efflux system)